MQSYIFIAIVFLLFIAGGIYFIVLSDNLNKEDKKDDKKKQ